MAKVKHTQGRIKEGLNALKYYSCLPFHITPASWHFIKGEWATFPIHLILINPQKCCN